MSKQVLKPYKKKEEVKKENEEEKKEFLQKIFWVKLVVSIVLGLFFGIIELTGLIGFVCFFALYFFVGYLYVYVYLQTDDNLYGGLWEVLPDSTMATWAVFMLFWIGSYTGFHHSV